MTFFASYGCTYTGLFFHGCLCKTHDRQQNPEKAPEPLSLFSNEDAASAAASPLNEWICVSLMPACKSVLYKFLVRISFAWALKMVVFSVKLFAYANFADVQRQHCCM